MAKLTKISLALILGVVIAFFGVFLSVFADGSLGERITTMAVVLIIYAILGASFGYLERSLSWKWGIILGSPGSLALLAYSFKESSLWFFSILYIALIFATSCGAAYLASNLRLRK